MANAKRAYSTDWVIAPESLNQWTDRSDLLRHFYKSEKVGHNKKVQLSSNHTVDDALIEQGTAFHAEVISFPVYKQLVYAPSESMWAMQEWDGYVTSIDNENFSALMLPIGKQTGDYERLEYPLALLTEADRKNIIIGSLFRLSAGYSRKATGQVRQQLAVYFRPRSKKPAAKPVASQTPVRKLFAKSVNAPASSLFARD